MLTRLLHDLNFSFLGHNITFIAYTFKSGAQIWQHGTPPPPSDVIRVHGGREYINIYIYPNKWVLYDHIMVVVLHLIRLYVVIVNITILCIFS